jgi:hypothetical protein
MLARQKGSLLEEGKKVPTKKFRQEWTSILSRPIQNIKNECILSANNLYGVGVKNKFLANLYGVGVKSIKGFAYSLSFHCPL